MVLFGGYALQTIGLVSVEPAQSGFSTGLSVAFVPLLVLVQAPVLWAILVNGIFGTSLAYVVQTAFQRDTSATQLAIIFTMEPICARLG